tara:strand:+ start:3262 stop:3909 length:648 start_codon:yes stop_codon:yes gene_type:complete
MANQDNLTIGGIGADPSGSHPNDTFKHWTESNDDMAIKFTTTSDNIPQQTAAVGAGAVKYVPGKVINLGPVRAGTFLSIPNTTETEVGATWQYYKPSIGNNYRNNGSATENEAGTGSDMDGGTWTNVAAPSATWGSRSLTNEDINDLPELLEARHWRIRVKMTDGGGGMTVGVQNDGIDAVCAGACITIPVDKKAINNDTITNPVTVGGIGADPS